MDPWVQVVSGVGFPAAIAIYLLVTGFNRIGALTDRIGAVADAVNNVQGTLMPTLQEVRSLMGELRAAMPECRHCEAHELWRQTREMRIDPRRLPRVGGGAE
jgi:hypothetical protein